MLRIGDIGSIYGAVCAECDSVPGRQSKPHPASQDLYTIGTCRRDRGGRMERRRMQASRTFPRSRGRVPVRRRGDGAGVTRPRYRDKSRIAVHRTRLAMVECVAKGLCRLEGRHPGGGDGDRLAGARTAPLASCAGPCCELPESGDGDGLALGKRAAMVEVRAPSAAATSAVESDERAATRAHSSDRVMGALRARVHSRCSAMWRKLSSGFAERSRQERSEPDWKAVEDTVRGGQCTCGSVARRRAAGRPWGTSGSRRKRLAV